jgi:hypothetical protein
MDLVFHLPQKSFDDWRGKNRFSLYEQLEEIAVSLNGTVKVIKLDTEGIVTGTHDDGCVHIVENGNVQRPRFLNATLAYIPPYWHLDPQGVLAASSISARLFDIDLVPWRPAKRHFDGLHDRLVKKRHSRYAQKTTVEALPEGMIAVFLQGRLPHERGLTYCTSEEMLRIVAQHSGGRKIVVKPHPRVPWHDLQSIMKVQAEGFDLISTDANIHDILAKCSATVSFSSAVALEGFLHKKPAILFGKSDFHHFCETVTDPSDFPDALTRALCKKHGYEKFLYWYFGENCLSVKSQQFASQALKILALAQSQG